MTRGNGPLLRGGTIRRTALGIFVLLAFMTGLFVLAPSGAGAEGPVSRFLGFVSAAPTGPLPTKIRAVSDDGSVCGTADVQVTSDFIGFYELLVVSGDDKAGCPREGEYFTFLLLYGSVDDGQAYDTGFGIRYQGGVTQTQHVSVDPLAPPVESWSGTPPPSGGYALMVWGGPDGAPVGQALALLPVEVEVLYRYDAVLKRFRMYVPGGPDFVQTYTVMGAGDIVVVKAR